MAVISINYLNYFPDPPQDSQSGESSHNRLIRRYLLELKDLLPAPAVSTVQSIHPFTHNFVSFVMSHQIHPQRIQQSDASYRPKDSFRQEGSGANRSNRSLSERIHLPLEGRLELPNSQNNFCRQPVLIRGRMDLSQRNFRYITQGEGGSRGSLDERIGGFSDHSWGNSGRQFSRSRKEEPINYDDKPTARNFEERVNVDSRTLEERISATSTSTRRLNHSNGNEGNVNKTGTSNQQKQGKKPSKVQKQTTRIQEPMVLTEPRSQEEINGGTISVRNTSDGKLTTAPGAVDEVGSKQGNIQQQTPVTKQEEDEEMDLHASKKNLQFESPPAPTAAAGTQFPVNIALQEQLREKALASMKRKAHSGTKEKDLNTATNSQQAIMFLASSTAAGQALSPVMIEENSPLSALERTLNTPALKRKIDPERDAAVDAMLAEAHASSSSTEDKNTSSQQVSNDEVGLRLKESLDHTDRISAIPLASNPEPGPKAIIPKQISNTVDRRTKSPKGPYVGDKITRKKETEADAQFLVSENQLGEAENIQSETKQKLTKLPVQQTSTTASQGPPGKYQYPHDKYIEDENDSYLKEKPGSFPASVRHSYTQGRRGRDVDEVLEQPGFISAERRSRHWEDRSEILDREYKGPLDDARRRPEKPRSHIGHEYRDDIYRNVGVREEARDPMFTPHRIPPLSLPNRQHLSTEEYTFHTSEHPSYSALRYLPIRGEEHLARLPDYDPYYKDLAEWLEITGFHDVDYRQIALRRHRERELDRLYAMRAAASVATRGEEKLSPMDRRPPQGSGLMLPPQLPLRAERGSAELAVKVGPRLHTYPSRAAQHPLSHSAGERLPPRYTDGYRNVSPSAEGVGVKRRLAQEEQPEGRRPEKSSRTSYDAHPRVLSPRLEEESFDRRGVGTEVNENGPGRRNPEAKIEEIALPHSRHPARPSTPVREIQEKLAARSPSPSRFHENEQRRAAFKDSGSYKNRVTEDDQSSNSVSRSGKKPYEKGDRRGGSPDDLSPKKAERVSHRGRGGYNHSGRYQQLGDDHRHEYDDEFKSPGRGNLGHRRTSFDDSRRRPGYGRGVSGDYGRDWHNRNERRGGPPANRTMSASEPMDANSAASSG